ncbi:MAG: hypothetical protein ACLS5N_04500, partial [Ruminococcus sp.]|uniref:hypothetical protein n=1 Tax=Ruminococcus bromii TaxID=40518 RepID=UPI0025DFC966
RIGYQILIFRHYHIPPWYPIHLPSQIPICLFLSENGQSRLELPIYLENYAIFKALHRFKHHLV